MSRPFSTSIGGRGRRRLRRRGGLSRSVVDVQDGAAPGFGYVLWIFPLSTRRKVRPFSNSIGGRGSRRLFRRGGRRHYRAERSNPPRSVDGHRVGHQAAQPVGDRPPIEGSSSAYLVGALVGAVEDQAVSRRGHGARLAQTV